MIHFYYNSRYDDLYNEELCNILDKHAPQEHCLVALMKPTPWTSEDIKFEKQKKKNT